MGQGHGQGTSAGRGDQCLTAVIVSGQLVLWDKGKTEAAGVERAEAGTPRRRL